MKIAQFRIERGIKQADVCERAGICNTPMLSRMEHGMCNPTPEQFKALCDMFGCSPNELADRAEVSYGLSARKDSHKLNTRISHRIPEARLNEVKEAVKVCGYGTVQAWLETCVYRLLTEANKKRPHDLEHRTGAKEK